MSTEPAYQAATSLGERFVAVVLLAAVAGAGFAIGYQLAPASEPERAGSVGLARGWISGSSGLKSEAAPADGGERIPTPSQENMPVCEKCNYIAACRFRFTGERLCSMHAELALLERAVANRELEPLPHAFRKAPEGRSEND